jgi:hypothetical protein
MLMETKLWRNLSEGFAGVDNVLFVEKSVCATAKRVMGTLFWRLRSYG